MQKLTLILLFFSFLTPYKAQEKERADSTLSHLYYEVGVGVSNIGEMLYLGIQSQPIFPENDSYTFSISQHLKQQTYIRIGLVAGYYKEQIVGGHNNYLHPFIVTAGVEKKKTKNNWVFNYGSDIYYSTTLKGTNIGGTYWQAEQYAFGISGLAGVAYFIQPNLSIRSETELGIGLQQGYKNKGFVTQQVLTPSILPIKALSLELKYHF